MQNDTDNHARIAEWLFCKTYEDLKQRTSAKPVDRYTLLGCAPLLRKLLMDSWPLFDRVSSRYAMTLNFRAHLMKEVNPHRAHRPAGADSLYWMQGDFIRPGLDSTEIRSYNRPGWLRHKLGECADLPITVRDLIKFTSHVEGGVHAGRASTPVERKLHQLTPMLLADSVPPGVTLSSPVGQLRSVSLITLDAMFPLYVLLSSGFAEEFRSEDNRPR